MNEVNKKRINKDLISYLVSCAFYFSLVFTCFICVNQPVFAVDDVPNDIVVAEPTAEPDPILQQFLNEEQQNVSNDVMLMGFIGNNEQLPYAPYVEVSSNVGNIKIYITSDKMEYLTVSSADTLVNISSNTIYGYYFKNNEWYRVTFGSFQTPTYRDVDYDYNNKDLNISSVNSVYGNILDTSDELYEFNYLIVIIALIFCFWLFGRVFK